MLQAFFFLGIPNLSFSRFDAIRREQVYKNWETIFTEPNKIIFDSVLYHDSQNCIKWLWNERKIIGENNEIQQIYEQLKSQCVLCAAVTERFHC